MERTEPLMPLYLYALNFSLVVIEIISLDYLAGGFFEKKSSALIHYLSMVIYIILHNLLLFLFQNLPFVRVIMSVVLATCWLSFTYRSALLKKFFVSVFWISFFSAIDSLFLMSPNFIHIGDTFSFMDDPFAYYLLCYSAKVFEFLISVVLCTWAKKHFHHQHATKADWLRILFFPIASAVIAIYLLRIMYMEPYLSKELFLCVVILLLADLMAIFLLNHLSFQQKTILENAVLRQNIKLEYDHIKSLKEAYSEERRQTHDFQNQLAVLRDLATHNAPQHEFARYLDHILSVTFPSSFYIDTGRLVVDIILSQKNAVAKTKGIKLTTVLTDLSDFPLPDDALVVVLTNLIDNAIEACEKVAEDKRSILIKIQNLPDAAILYIENPTSHPVRIKDNYVLTTKSNSFSHGFGLKNTYAMLSQHNAIYVIDYNATSKKFCFSAQISK